MHLLLLILIFSCSCVAQDSISTTPWEQLIPSDRLPPEITAMHGNDNIDAAWYKGRYYVGFRTSPTHFASKKTKIYVMSSEDRANWKYETEFWMNTDMREPRFLVYHDTLFFYYFEAGKHTFKFEPKKIWLSKTVGNGKWSKKKDINMDGYVPWRLKVRNDTIYMSSYYGVGTYKNKDKADLRFFISTDGEHFQPISKEPQISTKNATEAAFEFDSEGNMWGCVRLEGSGSYVVFAHQDSLHKWQYWFSTYKYDSPIMFEHKSEIYLISRRNVKGPATKVEVPTPAQRRNNLIRYSFSRKKTAIYWLDKKNKTMVHLEDFPSTGDTAFPALAKVDDNSYYLLNYSSNIHKKNKNWINGQLGKTYIYATILTFHSKK